MMKLWPRRLTLKFNQYLSSTFLTWERELWVIGKDRKIGRNLGILKRKKLLSDHQKAPQKSNRFFEWLARTIRAWIVSTSNRSTAQFLRICVPGPQFWRIDANKGFIFVLPVKVRRAEWEGKGAIENSRRKRSSESSAAVLFAKVSRRRIVSPVHIIIANADPPL